MGFFSTTLTAKTEQQLLLANKPHIINVSQISIVVRSMGAASYVGVGGFDSQDRQLTTIGDSISIDTPKDRKTLDVSTLFVSSDANDAVLEIIGESFNAVVDSE